MMYIQYSKYSQIVIEGRAPAGKNWDASAGTWINGTSFYFHSGPFTIVGNQSSSISEAIATITLERIRFRPGGPGAIMTAHSSCVQKCTLFVTVPQYSVPLWP